MQFFAEATGYRLLATGYAAICYPSRVSTTLHRVSGICFYVLGLTYFLAYIGVRNDVLGSTSAVWMQVADLPFALSAITYGGLSFYRSLTTEEGSTPLALGIGIPLTFFFILILFLNFWGVWPFA
jgi:hypothetical protein